MDGVFSLDAAGPLFVAMSIEEVFEENTGGMALVYVILSSLARAFPECTKPSSVRSFSTETAITSLERLVQRLSLQRTFWGVMRHDSSSQGEIGDFMCQWAVYLSRENLN